MLLVRVSPRSAAETSAINGSLERQETFLGMLVPLGVPCRTIRLTGVSAAHGDLVQASLDQEAYEDTLILVCSYDS